MIKKSLPKPVKVRWFAAADRLLPALGSNRGYKPSVIICQFLLNLCLLSLQDKQPLVLDVDDTLITCEKHEAKRSYHGNLGLWRPPLILPIIAYSFITAYAPAIVLPAATNRRF